MDHQIFSTRNWCIENADTAIPDNTNTKVPPAL